MDSNNDNKPNEQNSDSTPPVSEEPKVQQSVDGVIAPPQPENTPVHITSDGEITEKPVEEPPKIDREAFDKAVAAEEALHSNETTSTSDEVVVLKGRVKKLKTWLAVTVILLVAVGSALAVYFYSQNQVNSDLEAAKAENAKLQQEATQNQDAATQATIATLNTELEAAEAKNAELTAQVTELETLSKELYKVATELKAQCGAACSSTEVPADPSAE